LRLWGAYCLVLAPLRAKTTAAQKSEVQTVIDQRPRVLSVQSALHVLRGTQKLSYGPILARVHASPSVWESRVPTGLLGHRTACFEQRKRRDYEYGSR
jgi:hypothetical protein